MAKIAAHKVDPETVVVALDPTVTGAAYAKHGPAAAALPLAGLIGAIPNVTAAAGIAIAGTRNLLARRAEVDAQFKKVPWAAIERVEEVAHAAQHADALVRLQEDESSAFGDVLPRVNELRAILLDDLDLLVRRKLVPAKFVADVRKGDNTMRDKANDLRDCAEHYSANWEKVSHRTTVSPEELKEADTLATTIIARLGTLDVSSLPKPGEPTAPEMRRRIFTLLDRDYDVVRRIGAYLFWDQVDGWQAYVPSLWSGRRKGAAAGPAAQPPAEPTPSEPAVLPGNAAGFVAPPFPGVHRAT